MTSSIPPSPDFPPPLPPHAPPPAPRRPRNWVVIGSAAAVIAAVIGTGIWVVQAQDGHDEPRATTSTSAPADDTVAAADDEEPEVEPAYAELDADSFEITLRTTDRQCFGSAGCNVTVEPELSYLGIEDIDPDSVYEITYEIKGDASGPVIATAELSDETSLNYQPSSISTASSSTKVSVKITDVTEQMY
ncbi:hypothetical protein [Streptomyces sp. CRN 30]|uniref:hypothetical protein n=1 Tax=Streptomyces sp. CRN 30 TaxID=3075613 RepID=UPI002A808593|nr:hypothetical protein [Streptomyces sp. CRN 30]